MNRITRTWALFALLCLTAPALWARALPIPEAPSLPTTSYILVDFHSGQTLASQKPNSRIEPASITKLMTAYIVFSEINKGNLSLEDMVTISEKAWRKGGSKMFIEVGEQVSVENLVKGMTIVSGNDATVALAEHIAGTEQTFATYMNQYAADIGLDGSNFTNATGWPGENHYMTAADIATLAKRLIEDFPEFYGRYYSQRDFTYSDIKQYNRNALLWSDKTVDGVKTGHTESAGYCLVASAERDGMRLISVVTGTDSNNARKSASQALLNYGFRFFETYKLFDADQPISEVRVWKGQRQTLPLVTQGPVHVAGPRGQRAELSTTAELPSRILAPVEAGQKMGNLKVTYDGNTIAELPLYAGKQVPAGGIFRRLMDEVILLFQ